jgi:signal transduction histidine kinase
VNYTRLAPGTYRFLMGAEDVLVSPATAAIGLRLLPPVWQRWWFLILVALLAAGLVYWAYHSHLERLLDLERVRTRIATDLHDDIGSSLTQIAIMSEVARQRAPANEPQLSAALDKIADLSRELVDAMSDIVWAIDPKRDRLSDLVQRMRRFASDIFSGRSIEFDFLAPRELADKSLTADVRRQVFLVFKESIKNLARHSGCHHVEISLEIEGSSLVLKVSDDGRGFDLTAADEESCQVSCHGLSNMEHRAQYLGGSLHVISQPSGGTCVLLQIPVASGLFRIRKRSLLK